MSPSLFQSHLLARKDNPKTSKDAAKKMVESGALNRQEEMVCNAIIRFHWNKSHIDFTTKDIANNMSYMSYDKAYDICRKRFSDLEMKGKIELIWIGYDDDKSKHIYKRRDGCRVWRLK